MNHQIPQWKKLHVPTECSFGFGANLGTDGMKSLVLCRSSWTEFAVVVVVVCIFAQLASSEGKILKYLVRLLN